MPEKSGTAPPRGADCPNAGAAATTETTMAFDKVLSFIAASPQSFVNAMLHGFCPSQKSDRQWQR
jgi:hypothetical protein